MKRILRHARLGLWFGLLVGSTANGVAAFMAGLGMVGYRPHPFAVAILGLLAAVACAQAILSEGS